jgi:RNA polymerase sigma factor (sigma-70 family)
MWFKKDTKECMESWIEGCFRNDRKAQEALYMHFFDKMFALCKRHTSDDELAVSILNDGFLKIFKNIHQYKNNGSFEGWVRRIVFNTLSDHFRSQKNQVHLVLEEIQSNTPASNPEIIENLRCEDIIHLIEDLPEKPKEVLYLFAIEGYSHKEISTLLDIPEGTSKWYLTTARTLLKEKMGNNFLINSKAI